VVVLALMGALLFLLVFGIFVPLKDCWCRGFPPYDRTISPTDGWRCPTCGGRGKISLYESLKQRREGAGGLIIR